VRGEELAGPPVEVALSAMAAWSPRRSPVLVKSKSICLTASTAIVS